MGSYNHQYIHIFFLLLFLIHTTLQIELQEKSMVTKSGWFFVRILQLWLSISYPRFVLSEIYKNPTIISSVRPASLQDYQVSGLQVCKMGRVSAKYHLSSNLKNQVEKSRIELLYLVDLQG
jgi:hypothetical protein